MQLRAVFNGSVRVLRPPSPVVPIWQLRQKQVFANQLVTAPMQPF